MATLRLGSAIWLVAYLLTMIGLVLLLVAARRRTIAELDAPQARAEWQVWKAKVAREQSGPVQRRVPASDEPPALILLRDHFPVVVSGCLVVASSLFGFLMIALRGSLGNGPPAPRGETPPESARQR